MDANTAAAEYSRMTLKNNILGQEPRDFWDQHAHGARVSGQTSASLGHQPARRADAVSQTSKTLVTTK
jgi:hypothetical protein